MNELKWGIIGCGNVVEKKSGPAFLSGRNSHIQAVMSRNPEKASLAAKALQATAYYTTVNELVEDPNINAVYIATPPGLHLEQALLCCKAGLPTYIEKPIARNHAEALQIVEAFEQSGVPLFIAHYRRALPKFKKVQELLSSGVIGTVCEADFRLNRIYQREEMNKSWLYQTKLSGGGKFYDIAPHSIDIMVYLFGDFIQTYGLAANHNEEYSVEDLVVMSFQTANGVLGTANFNAIAFDKKDSMTIYGTLGKLEFSMHDGGEPITVTKDNLIETYNTKAPAVIQEPMIHSVIEELLTGVKTDSCSGREALETYRIIDAVLDQYYGGRDGDFWNQ